MQTPTPAAAGQPASPFPKHFIPPIGAWWPGQGGIYAGIARGVGDAPDHHLILSQVKPDKGLDWQAALDWAGALQNNDCADWCLPTRSESALLFANVRDEFEPRWHWTSEEYDSSYAWGQTFFSGDQVSSDKSFQARARAVRRLVIQSFSHSWQAAAVQTPVSPSQQPVPLCTECQHHKDNYCHHLDFRYEVNGAPMLCDHARGVTSKCGQFGRRFAPLLSQPVGGLGDGPTA